MKIGIAGLGIVGGALAKWFKNNSCHNIFIYDPPKGYNNSLKFCDFSFIAVPVPTNSYHEQDYSILEDALSHCRKTNVFIRSTVLPGTNDKYGTWSCPEFLTERTAYEDTCKMDILTGCPHKYMMDAIFPKKKSILMSNREAELAKYAHNGFGAVKVNYFNIINEICNELQADYKKVLEGVLMSGYINETHTRVPGPDGKYGYGGTCFPKDLRAFAKQNKYATFDACLKENSHFRKEVAKELTPRRKK